MRRTWGSFGSATGLAASVRYTPAGGGDAVEIRVMPVVKDVVADDPFAPRMRQTGHAFHVMAADVPDCPQAGATLATLDATGDVAETFTVTEPALSLDGLRTVWLCHTGPGAPFELSFDFRDTRNSGYLALGMF